MFKTGKYKNRTYEEIYNTDIDYCKRIAARLKTSPEDFKRFMINKLKNTQKYKCITCTQFCEKMDLKTKLLFDLLPIEINIVEIDVKIEKEKNLSKGDHGTFIDYLTRYYIMYQRKQKFYDKPTEKMIKIKRTNEILQESYEKAQKLEATPQDMFNVCIHSVLYRNFMAMPPKTPYIIENNYDNLFEWLKNIKEQNILLGPEFKYEYIYGEADLILNNEVLIDIKTSSLPFKKKNFNQLLIYAALHYKQNKVVIKKIAIWNFTQGFIYESYIDEKIILSVCEILFN